MARAIVGNRATSGSDQRPMYDQILRPTTDRTINRGDRRPIVRSIVASCNRSCEQSWHPACDRSYEHSWHPVTERRSIITPDARLYDQSWGATIDRTINRTSCDRSLLSTTDRTINRGNHGNRGIKQPIVRSIVASRDRSYDQLCDYRSAIIHDW